MQAALSGLTPSEGGRSLVSDVDHLQLSRLLIEFGWRVDNGKAQTIHELFTDDGELTIGAVNAVGRDAIRAWGLAIDNRQNGIHHVHAGNRAPVRPQRSRKLRRRRQTSNRM